MNIKQEDSSGVLAREIAYFMRRLYRQGLTTTSGGNISARDSDGSILITPSASDKGRARASEIGRMDMDGKIIGAPFKPSIESRMHLEIYRKRTDVMAVVHAHPVTASAFAASSARIPNNHLAESYAILGEIAYAEYFCMGTEQLAFEVARAALDSNCVIMRNHGALAVGRSLLEAFDRLEVLEAAARIAMLAMGPLSPWARPLEAPALSELDIFMGRAAPKAQS
ncbi:MAG: hypothetical protein A2X49_01945 [Lentisphaerae bacterium GWF2_52_8]|nr:MAG: hypothetical protein A2X49_01945 [Lentisphaerae bacterium GWF2_52_8]